MILPTSNGNGTIIVESNEPIPDWVRRFFRNNPDMHIPTAAKMFEYMGFRVTIRNADGAEVNVNGDRIIT